MAAVEHGHARSRLAVGLAVGVALCAWCAWVSGFQRSSVGAWATWSVTLAAVAAVDVLIWRGRRSSDPAWSLTPARPWPRPGHDGVAARWAGSLPWLALVTVAVAWDVLGLVTGPHEPHLTISALTQAFRPLNAAVLLTWIVAGVAFAVALARRPGSGGPQDAGFDAHPEAAPAHHRQDLGDLGDPADRAGGPGQGGADHAAVLPWWGGGTLPGLLLPHSQAAGVAFWLGIGAAGVGIEIWARHSSGRVATAGELTRLVASRPVGWGLLVAAWLVAGWHLFAH